MKKKSADYIGDALVLSLVLIILDLIGGFAHLRFEAWFKWLPGIILIIAVTYYCFQYGKKQTQGVTFGNVFGYGMKLTSIVAIITVIFTLISIFLIFPELKDQFIEKARTDMEAKGGYSEEMIDKGVEMTRKFFLPFAVIGAIVGTYIFGVIGSLLGAAFTKKTDPDVFQEK